MRPLAFAPLLLVSLKASAMLPPFMAAQVATRSVVTGLGSAAREGVSVELSSRYEERSKLISGTQSVDNKSGERSESLTTTLLLDLRVAEQWSLVLVAPFVRRRALFGGADQTTRGFGDASIYAKRRVYRDTRVPAPREVLLLAGIKAPTGSTSQGDASGRYPISQQPGTGTLDFIVGGAAVWGMPWFTAFGDATYKINGRKSYTFGNLLAVNAGASWPLPRLENWRLSGVLGAELAARDTSDFGGPGVLPGGAVRDTGYEKLFFTPGLQWRPTNRSSLTLDARLPLRQNARGTQLASSVDYGASASLQFDWPR